VGPGGRCGRCGWCGLFGLCVAAVIVGTTSVDVVGVACVRHLACSMGSCRRESSKSGRDNGGGNTGEASRRISDWTRAHEGTVQRRNAHELDC
jgi:hypothetical protein